MDPVKRSKSYIIDSPEARRHVMRALVHDLAELPKDRPFIVTVAPLERPISDGQRKLWWVWMEILGEAMGDTKQGVYESLKHDLVSWMEGRGISDLSSDEMHFLMDEVQRAAASMGWTLPSSMDAYYASLEQMEADRGKKFW